MTSCPVGFNTIYKNTETDVCAETPIFWNDVYGDTCRDYVENNFCQPDGAPGFGWSMDWGTFDEVGNPEQHCCGCGGGTKFKNPKEFFECKCPEGSSEVNGICIPTDSNRTLKKTGEFKKELTTGDNSFIDRLNINYTCQDYRDKLICDPSAPDRKGVNWIPALFDESILSACGSCGGGNKITVDIPIYTVELDCPLGTTLVNGECKCVVEGTTIVNGECKCIVKGSEVVNGECKCPSGLIEINGECKCPVGLIEINGECKCPSGLPAVNGVCSTCPQWSNLVNGRCVPRNGYIIKNGKIVYDCGTDIRKTSKGKSGINGLLGVGVIIILVYIISKLVYTSK